MGSFSHDETIVPTSSSKYASIAILLNPYMEIFGYSKTPLFFIDYQEFLKEFIGADRVYISTALISIIAWIVCRGGLTR